MTRPGLRMRSDSPRRAPSLVPPAGAEVREGALRALWVVLAVQALARASLAFVPWMGAWGLNLLRFVPPAVGWATWGLAAVALAPRVARRLERMLSALADPGGSPRRAYPAWILAAALTVWLLPDRLYFVGDFWLRQTWSQTHASVLRSLYPQGMPLDFLLHDTAVRAIASALSIGPGDVGRALGSLEAGLLAALAVRFARVMGLGGGAAFAAAAAVLWGGYLGLFCGYDKGFAELTLLTAAVGVFGIEAVRRGSGLVAMGVTLSLALMFHRMALGLLPACVTAWSLWFRVHGGPTGWRRPAPLASLAIGLATLAVMLPRIVAALRRWDAVHFMPAEVKHAGGPLLAAFAGTRAADIANLLLVLAPLALAAAAAAIALGRRIPRAPEGLVVVALVVPLVGAIPLLHPAQGLFRDWDDFAPAGAALALASAWLIGELLRTGRRFAWLGLPAALAAAAPSIQWLAHDADVGRGLAQVEAFVREPPARGEQERAAAWDYLGTRYIDLGRVDESAEAFARAAELTPSPKILREWATIERLRGDPEAAAAIYHRLLARRPDDAAAWLEYAEFSLQSGDTTAARRAAEQVLRLQPGQPVARAILAHTGASAPPRH